MSTMSEISRQLFHLQQGDNMFADGSDISVRSIDDPSGRLEASGAQQMAGVRLRSVDDLDAELFTRWLRQAVALERTT
ncbi:MAG TPA: hypothetical protein VGD71_44530 [Kribbella sp.]